MAFPKKTLFLLVLFAVPVVLVTSIYSALWFFFSRNPWGIKVIGKLRDQKNRHCGKLPSAIEFT